jgi:DNA-binding transcriptional LysR family regulator
MNSEPDWNLYRSFLAVLQDGSLSSAARRLALTQPTLTRHIDTLEAAIGAALFVRTQRGLSPTDMAMKLLPLAETMAATAAALTRIADDKTGAVNATVRISASEIVGTSYLPAILTALRRGHPGLAVEVALSDNLADLLRREADIAVRMSKPTQNVLMARRLPSVELGLYAHRDYLARKPAPVSMDSLAEHDLIGFDTETPMLRAMTQRFPAYARASFALRTDSDNVKVAAVRAGFGIGVCHVALAQRDASLVRVLPALVSIELDLWIVMHEDLKSNPACKAVFDALASGLSAIEGKASAV